jgi:putative ABC transport system permease protein
VALLALALRALAERPVRTAMSLASLAVSAALAVAMSATGSSFTAASQRSITLGREVDLVVLSAGPGGLDQAAVARVEAVDGVRTATALLRQVVLVDGRRTLLVGVGDVAGAIGDDAHCLEITGPVDAPGLVLGPGVQASASTPGTVALTGADHRGDVPVIGSMTCGPLQDLNGGRVVAAPLEVAQDLAGRRGRVDAVLVTAGGGSTPDLRRAISGALDGQALVGTPTEAVRTAMSPLRPVLQLLLLTSSLSVLVGAFLVFNTMSMAALERRGTLALFRALGARRRTLLATFLAEAAILGAVGSVLGIGLGALAVRPIIDALPPFLLDIVGVAPEAAVPLSSMALGVAVGVGAGLLGAAVPALEVLRRDPIEALRPHDAMESFGRSGDSAAITAAGLAAMAVGVLVAFAVDRVGPIIGILVLQLGFIAATFGQAERIARMAGAAIGWVGSVGRLAASNLERSARRTWATGAAVSVAIALVVVTMSSAANFGAAVDEQFQSLQRPDLWVQTESLSQIATSRTLPPDLRASIAAIPGVRDVAGGQAAYVVSDGDQLLVEGFSGESAAPLLARTPASARARVVAGEGIVVDQRLATARGVAVGDELSIEAPDGRRSFPVVAVVDIPSVSDGFVGMANDVFGATFGRHHLTWLEVHVDEGRSVAAVRADIERIGRGAELHVGTGSEMFRVVVQDLERTSAIFDVVSVAVVGGAAIAVLNTLLISVVQRRREFGVLRAIGAGRRQLRRTVLAEAAGIAAVGAGLGIAMGELGHLLALRAMEPALGTVIPYSFAPLPIAVALLVAAFVALVGSSLPMSRVAATEIVEAIAYE